MNLYRLNRGESMPNWNELPREKERKIEQRKECFSADFGNTPMAVLVGNLLTFYHKNREYLCESTDSNALTSQQNALKKILKQLLQFPVLQSEALEDNEFTTLLNENDKVRKYLRLFWDICPQQLQEKIYRYELKKWAEGKREGGKKRPILEKIINEQVISAHEWNLIYEGDTKDFFDYFQRQPAITGAAKEELEPSIMDSGIQLAALPNRSDTQEQEESKEDLRKEIADSYRGLILPNCFQGESEESYLNRLAGLAAVSRRFIVVGLLGKAPTEKKLTNQFLKEFFKSKEAMENAMYLQTEVTASDNRDERNRSQCIINGLEYGEHLRLLKPFQSIIEGSTTYKKHLANKKEQDIEDRLMMARALAEARALR